MPTHNLNLDGWLPTTLNQLMRLHHHARNRRLKGDADLIAVEAQYQDIPKATGKRRVSITIRQRKGVKTADPDAYLKSLLDALVSCQALVDDSGEWCEIGSVRYEVSERKGLVVELEDIRMNVCPECGRDMVRIEYACAWGCPECLSKENGELVAREERLERALWACLECLEVVARLVEGIDSPGTFRVGSATKAIGRAKEVLGYVESV